MTEVALVLGALAAVWAVAMPARLLGRRLQVSGMQQGSTWKRDLGAAMHKHAFRLTIALVGVGVLLSRM